MLRFVVDESHLPLPQAAVLDLVNRAEVFVGLIERCRTGRHAVAVHSGLYETDVLPGVPLYSLLFDSKHAGVLDPDLRQAVMQAIEGAVQWDVGPCPALPLDTAGSTPSNTTSLAFAAAQVANRRAVGVVPFLGDGLPGGQRQLTVSGVAMTLSFILTDSDCVSFWRTVPEVDDLDATAVVAIAEEMFPKTRIHPDIAQQAGRFSRPFRDLRGEIVRHIAALNDHYRIVFDKHGGENQHVIAEMRALTRIVVSPESPNTHRNRAAMAERDVSFGGVVVRCEWHAKLAWDVDRIHFSVRHPQVDGGQRLLVGIFARHLTT